MTNRDALSQKWPDPAHPGYPLYADQDGNHTLVLGDGRHEPAKWIAATHEWLLPGATLPKSAEWAANFVSYLSPVRTNADLRRAYRQGVVSGRALAKSLLKQAQAEAVREALAQHNLDLRAARRKGAEEMRLRAAEIAAATDTSLLNDRFSSYQQAERLDRWHRRLHAEAIYELPLPGDEAEIWEQVAY